MRSGCHPCMYIYVVMCVGMFAQACVYVYAFVSALSGVNYSMCMACVLVLEAASCVVGRGNEGV